MKRPLPNDENATTSPSKHQKKGSRPANSSQFTLTQMDTNDDSLDSSNNSYTNDQQQDKMNIHRNNFNHHKVLQNQNNMHTNTKRLRLKSRDALFNRASERDLLRSKFEKLFNPNNYNQHPIDFFSTKPNSKCVTVQCCTNSIAFRIDQVNGIALWPVTRAMVPVVMFVEDTIEFQERNNKHLSYGIIKEIFTSGGRRNEIKIHTIKKTSTIKMWSDGEEHARWAPVPRLDGARPKMKQTLQFMSLMNKDRPVEKNFVLGDILNVTIKLSLPWRCKVEPLRKDTRRSQRDRSWFDKYLNDQPPYYGSMTVMMEYDITFHSTKTTLEGHNCNLITPLYVSAESPLNTVDSFSGGGLFTEAVCSSFDTSTSQRIKDASAKAQNQNDNNNFVEVANHKDKKSSLIVSSAVIEMEQVPLAASKMNIPTTVHIQHTFPTHDWNDLAPSAGLVQESYKHCHLSIDGSPCQGISSANSNNAKVGNFDERNFLLWRQAREVVEYDIPYSIKENSIGLTHQRPDGKEPLINELMRFYVINGYQVQYVVLKGYFMGSPQSRQRGFLIATKVGLRMPLQSVFAAPHHIKDMNVTDSSAPGGYGRFFGCIVKPNQFSTPAPSVRDVFQGLPVISQQEQQHDGQHPRNQNGLDVYNHFCPPPTSQSANQLILDGFAPTMLASGSNGAGTGDRGGAIIHLGRRLTVCEGSRIQGFPPEYNFLWHADNASRLGKKYEELWRILGNAVPMPFGQWLGRMIINGALSNMEYVQRKNKSRNIWQTQSCHRWIEERMEEVKTVLNQQRQQEQQQRGIKMTASNTNASSSSTSSSTLSSASSSTSSSSSSSSSKAMSSLSLHLSKLYSPSSKTSSGRAVYNENFMNGLTPQQRSIVNAQIDTSQIIEAGPGSGKTHTLSFRIHRLIQAGVSPSAILILSFTRNAAQELSRRVQNITSKNNTVPLSNCRTMHSFAFSILKIVSQYVTIFHHFQDHQLCADLRFNDVEGQLRLVLEARRQIMQERELSSEPLTKKKSSTDQNVLLHRASIAKSQYEDDESRYNSSTDTTTNTTTADLHNAQNLQMVAVVAEKKKEWLKKFSSTGKIPSKQGTNDYETLVFERYQVLLGQAGRCDYEDVLHYLYVLLRTNNEKNQEIKQILRSHFQYIVLDESQDLNAIQLKLILLLIGREDNHHRVHVIACGDPNQSIYAFRGSLGKTVFDQLLEVPNNKYTVQRCQLTHNFRSQPEIVSLSNVLLPSSNNMISAVQNVPQGLGNQGSVEFTVYEKDVRTGKTLNEIKCICKKIQRMHDKMVKSKWKDFCILTFTNKEMESIKIELNMLVIPFQEWSSSNNDEDKVLLSTIHSAKGAEASNVFVVGCQAPRKNVSKEEQKERERLYFVALTRAMYRIYFSCVRDEAESILPSKTFEKLQGLQQEQNEEEEDEELEMGHDDDDGSLSTGTVYHIRWVDEEVYAAAVTNITNRCVDIKWQTDG